MEENSLVSLAQQGDRQAFESLLETHYDRIYGFAIKWCGNHADAQDITQMACVKLAKSIKQYKHEAAFTTWLYRLVVNCAKDWQRSQQRHQLDVTQEEIPHAPGKDTSDLGVYLQQVMDWIEQLGDELKETVVLVLGEGFSHAEAAQILNVKEKTVSWRIHSVRQKISCLNTDKGGLS